MKEFLCDTMRFIHNVTMNNTSNTTWYGLSASDAIATQRSSLENGLSGQEVQEREKMYGRNELTKVDGSSPWAILFEQFKNVLIIVLLIAVGLSAVLGHELEAITIGIIVLFAIILGFVQEYRAERAIEALKKMAAPTASVLRDGEEREIPAEELVPGDIVFLAAGDRVPADGRIVESVNLHADEAPLTGESVPVAKTSDALTTVNLPVGDQKNMLFAGTAITYGRGGLLVTSTGMQTEFGRIAGMLGSVEKMETPLQKNLDQVGKRLAQVAFVIVLLVAGLGVARGQPLLEMFIFGVALAVAVVPEALPAVVTISLAIGVQRMVKRHALVRRLPAVETLGSTSVICSDKTGTLTKDEMTIRRIAAAGQILEVTGSGYDPHGAFMLSSKETTPAEEVLELLRTATLASDARLKETTAGVWDIKGDPTEGAMVVAAAKAGIRKDQLDEEFPRLAEIPFTSETKRMITLHKRGDGTFVCAKGAPEMIVEVCTQIRTAQGVLPFTAEEKARVLEEARHMADEALRVLAVATKEAPSLAEAEHGLTFLGLMGMIDPPRPEAKAAVQQCADAGIRVIMITGDHPVTARAVARELGILHGNRVLTGLELEAMSDTEFAGVVEEIDVFARVSPVHKLKIVTALQARGHTVAMTGDGVNDAPALKKADIGIAMGITGTDVSREAAEITLTDDNFASIVAAVEEGRGIFGNIKKYLMYLLSSNIGELFLMVGTTLLGLPLPLSAVQILYVNLATDGLPALALAVDPPEQGLMQRPPRSAKSGIFSRPVVFLMLLGGLWSAIVNVSLFGWGLTSGRPLEEVMTMTFLSLVLIQFFKAYSFRSDRDSVFRRPFANHWLNAAVFWELLLLLCVVYVPFLHQLFGTYYVSLQDWGIILVLAASVIPVLEIGKWLVRRGTLGQVM